MGGNSFRFRRFIVQQRRSAMKVGTDGVILGSWASCYAPTPRILDVGTGTGLIALMIAQRLPTAKIDAVEIDIEATYEAADNFRASPFSDRLRAINIDFQSFAQSTSTKYDLIVSNPPYFDGTYKSDDTQRTAARHKELLPTGELIDGVLRVIEPNNGRFIAIFPYTDGTIFIAHAANSGLYCHRMLEIVPKPDKGAKRLIAEFALTRCLEPSSQRLTVLSSEGDYSKEYRELTGDFYIRF